MFTAHIISGAGRGKRIGTPTMNLDLRDIPKDLQEGIYACFVELPARKERVFAAMHYGPRPVFKDSLSCEVHLLDAVLSSPPQSLTVIPVERIRDVRNFPTSMELQEEIERDIQKCRAILQAHAADDQTTDRPS